MLIALHDERRSFLFFLIFILVTAFFFAFLSGSSVSVGLFGILWGVFGFFRLLYLTPNQFTVFPKILSLPSRILFGMGQQEEKLKDSILKRLVQPDILFWLGGSVVFICWALFCSFYPAEITMVQTLRLKQEVLVDFPIKAIINPYAIMLSLSLYGMIGVIIYSAFSYSHSQMAVRWACYSLLPVFLLGTILTILFAPMASSALLVNIQTLKGGGLGQANILEILAPNMMAKSGTGLVKRFTELGSVGAYGVYVIFIPALIIAFRTFFHLKRTSLTALICLIIFIMLAVLDVFWIASPLIDGLTVLGLSLAALCWGNLGNQKEA